MRQVGILAAAGLFCLENMIDRLKIDHKNAKTIASSVHSSNNPCFQVDMDKVQTNMVLLACHSKVSVTEVCDRFGVVTDDEESKLGASIKVLAWVCFPHNIYLKQANLPQSLPMNFLCTISCF